MKLAEAAWNYAETEMDGAGYQCSSTWLLAEEWSMLGTPPEGPRAYVLLSHNKTKSSSNQIDPSPPLSFKNQQWLSLAEGHLK